MRRGYVIASLFFAILIVNLLGVSAAAGGVEAGLEGTLGEFESAKDNLESVKEGRWDYLGKEWQKILLENKFVSAFDGFLKNFSFLFIILFGMPYSLSLTLLLVILLWGYFFFKFGEIFSDYTSFSFIVAFAIALGFSILLAQVGFFKGLIEFFGWLVFSQEASWIRVFILFAITAGLIFLYKLSSLTGDILKAKKKKSDEEFAKEMEKIDRKILGGFAKAITDAFKK